MGKVDNYAAGRSAGMILAHDIVKEGGIEALRKEIKFRNISGINVGISQKELDERTDKIKKRTLARPVIALYKETAEGCRYTNGFQFGKAVKIEISPNYEDVSDYGDINDTEEEQMFVDADITLGVSEIPTKAESAMLGHEMAGNEVTSNASDRASPVGVGIRTRKVVSGKVEYVAVWICKAIFTEDGQNHETKGSTIEYTTPIIKGKAVPDKNGDWRKKKVFETSKEADDWLDQMAGIEQEER